MFILGSLEDFNDYFENFALSLDLHLEGYVLKVFLQKNNTFDQIS